MNDVFEAPKLSFVKIGKYDYTKDSICDFNDIPRPFYSLALITKGCGDFISKKKIVSVKEGDMIFVPMYSTYMSKWHEESVSTSIHFQFDIPSPFSYNNKYEIQKIVPGDFKLTNKMFEEIYRKYNSGKSMYFGVSGLFFCIMDKVYPYLKYQKTSNIDDKIKKAIYYIEQHYTEGFTVSFLAKLCNMSVSNFHLCIKKQLGMSAIEYKHKVCIHHAELMLLDNPEKSIEEISDYLGFNSSIYFREIFKKVTGETPRGYRNKYGKSI